MSKFIQVSENTFIKQSLIYMAIINDDDTLSLLVGNGGDWHHLDKYYSPYAKRLLGIGKIKQENSTRIEIEKSLDSFTQWWAEKGFSYNTLSESDINKIKDAVSNLPRTSFWDVTLEKVDDAKRVCLHFDWLTQYWEFRVEVTNPDGRGYKVEKVY